MFEEHQDIIDQEKWKAEAKELLKRAANLLHEYCAEINGDMNCYLGSEIEEFLKN